MPAACGQGERTDICPSKRRRIQRNSTHSTLDATSAQKRAEELGRKTIPADQFWKGSFLLGMAEEHRTEFNELLIRAGDHYVGGHRTWASVCSGSEGASFVMEAIATTYPEFVFHQVFACDNRPGVRQWIDRVVNPKRTASGQEKMCIFTDIIDLASETAECHVHGRRCRVPDANIIIGCSSCKDLSNLQGKPRGAPVLGREHSPGGTAVTWQGLLGYLDNHVVDLVIYENSDKLDDGNEETEENPSKKQKLTDVSNIEIFKEQFSIRGFEGQNMVLESMKFGTSAKRRRFWSVQVRTKGSLGCIEFPGTGDTKVSSVTDILKTFKGLLSLCQRRPCGVEALLLPDDDPHVEKELLKRIIAGKTSEPETWKLKHLKFYSNIRLPMGTPSPHNATASSPWYATLTGCQRSTLIFQHHKIQSSDPKRTAQDRCPILMLDVDQSPERTFRSTSIPFSPFRTITIAPCMTPHQKLWIHRPDGQERLLLGREALVLLGFPVRLVEEQLDQVTDAFQHDLAGNAMSFLVLLAVAQSAFASLHWRKQSVLDQGLGSISLPDADEAVGLLGMMERN